MSMLFASYDIYEDYKSQIKLIIISGKNQNVSLYDINCKL